MIRGTLLFLLACLSVTGQPFNAVTSLPFLARNPIISDIPGQIGGMFIRLRASDLATNVNVTAWTDEVHGITWTNATPATQPTNSPSGVWFNLGNNLSTATPPTFNGTQQVFVVFNYNTTTGFGTILGSGGGEGTLGILIVPSGFGVQTFLPSTVDAYWSKPDIGANLWHDAISVGGSNPIQGYTNGIAALTFNNPGGWPADWLGVNQNGTGDKYQGYITELIIWTNPTAFTSTQVSNLHYYATNTYKFSP